jgi:hypothetical protein
VLSKFHCEIENGGLGVKYTDMSSVSNVENSLPPEVRGFLRTVGHRRVKRPLRNYIRMGTDESWCKIPISVIKDKSSNF